MNEPTPTPLNPTPRTDTEKDRIIGDKEIYVSDEIGVMAIFARQLETELAAMRAVAGELAEALEAVKNDVFTQGGKVTGRTQTIGESALTNYTALTK